MEQVRLGLIASGSGTDADSIMSAYGRGEINNAEPVMLISTKQGAGCLQKAGDNNVPSLVIDPKTCGGKEGFRQILGDTLAGLKIQLVFLVGCIVVFEPLEGIAFYNIHPADPLKHGGKKMYGLTVHEHVLASIKDEIGRGMKTVDDRFFTFPTVHEVVGQDKPDQGQPLLQAMVEVPPDIIRHMMFNDIALSVAAERLQKYVLPFEWLMLPCAVEMAAKKILDARDSKE